MTLDFTPDHLEIERRVEALLFAAAAPLSLAEIARRLPEGADVIHEPTETDEFESMAKRETLELVRAYYRISDPTVRRRAFELIKALGGETKDSDTAGS